jgi:AraC-like DNA-binding protein/quercetin dioxygenase-like cupin family protein
MRSVGRVRWEDASSIISPQINAQMVHVWPFVPEFPIDVRFLKFGPKNYIRLKRHDHFELLVLHSGEVTFEIQGRHVPMGQGDLMVMGSTQLHRMSSYDRCPVKAAVLYFLPELIRGTEKTGDDIEYLMPFLVQDEKFPHVIPARTGIPAQVFDLMLRVSAELPTNSYRARLSVKTYLKMILVLLVNHYAAFRGSEDIYQRKQRDIERLAPLFEFIEQHYGEAITVEQAALVVRMSKSNFMRFFKQVTGQPFVAYLNHFRIAKAEVLLATTDQSIAEVSQAVGFCDQSYFGLVFRSVLGVPPRDFKVRAEKEAVVALE